MAYDPSASVASILAQFDIRLTAAETPTPTPTPFKTEIFVVTRARALGHSSTGLSANTLSRLEARLRHYGGYRASTNVKAAYLTYYLSPLYNVSPNAFALTAAIEQGGSNVGVKFGGASSRTANPTDLIIMSDVVMSSLGAGETIYSRTGAEFTVGQQVPVGYQRFPSDNTIEQQPGTSTGGSQVAGTGAMSVTSPYAGQTYGYGPSAFIGTVAQATTAIIVIGDSIDNGTTYDTVGDGFGNVGFTQRAIHAEQIGVFDASRGSNRASYSLPATEPPIFALAAYATHAIVGLATNDINAGDSLATIQANLLTVWAEAKAKAGKVYQRKIFPRTTSTDSWATAANQTPIGGFASGGVRDQLNAWFDTKVADGTLAGVIDLLSNVQDGSNPNVWAAGLTNDGVHPNSTTHAALVTPMRAIVTTWKL